MTLAAPKIRLLQVGRKHLALSEDDYRAILNRFGGCVSAKELDQRGFDDVMNHFRVLGFTSDARKATYGERINMASPGQVALIRKLWREAVDNPTDAALNAFLSNHFKVSALRFLPSSKASGAITALKAMVARRAAKAEEHQHAG